MNNTITAKVMQEELKKGVQIYLLCYEGALTVRKVIIHQPGYVSIKLAIGKTITYPDRGDKLEFVGEQKSPDLRPMERNALRNIAIIGVFNLN